jgi:hypothetical protein
MLGHVGSYWVRPSSPGCDEVEVSLGRLPLRRDRVSIA